MIHRSSFLPLVAVMALTVQTVSAAVITSNSTGDEFGENASACTLREAVQAANTNMAFGGCPAGSSSGTDVILTPGAILSRGGAGEDSNATGDLDITSAIQIEGTGRSARLMSAIKGSNDRIFDLTSSSAALYLSFLAMQGGIPGGYQHGGVIRHIAGTLVVNDSGLSSGLADYGGGLYSSGAGTLQLTRVSVYDNVAGLRGGGIYTINSSDHYLGDVTVSGNTAALSGGGIYTTGHLHLNSSTVTNNNAPDGAGLHYDGTLANATTVTINNTILARNSGDTGATRNADLLCNDNTVKGGAYNLVGNTQCTLAEHGDTQFGADPKLSPLFRYGYDLPVHALLDGSPAINAGAIAGASVVCPAGDARNRLRNGRCDIGAYEQVFDFTVDTTADDADDNHGDGVCHTVAGKCSLRAAWVEAGWRTGTTVRIPAGTYPLGSRLSVDFGYRPLQIAVFGAGPTLTQIAGGGSDRLFGVNGFDGSLGLAIYPINLAFVGVTLRGGVGHDNAFNSGGGAVVVEDANLQLVDDIVRNNHSVDSCGGGISVGGYLGTGVAWLERVSVIDNVAETSSKSYGGGICGHAYLRNSTVSHNQADFGGGFAGTGEISHSTIAGNIASEGAGVRAGNLILKNSIVANNHFPPGSSDGTGQDCLSVGNSSIESQGHNIIGNTLDCVMSGDTSSNLTNLSPGLSPLDRSAAPLPALALNARSPALDLVSAMDCFDAAGKRVWIDQRNAKRPAPGSTKCDAGSLEGNQSDILFADSYEFNP